MARQMQMRSPVQKADASVKDARLTRTAACTINPDMRVRHSFLFVCVRVCGVFFLSLLAIIMGMTVAAAAAALAVGTFFTQQFKQSIQT